MPRKASDDMSCQVSVDVTRKASDVMSGLSGRDKENKLCLVLVAVTKKASDDLTC